MENGKSTPRLSPGSQDVVGQVGVAFDEAGRDAEFADGALLVRPDKHIGWRSQAIPADPKQALLAAMTAILDREQARTDQGLVSPGISRNDV